MGNKSIKTAKSVQESNEIDVEYQGNDNDNIELIIQPLSADNMELSDYMQQVFTSIGITLNGYLSIIEFYNIIRSGLFGEKWQETFPNKLRLSHYKSLNRMQEQIKRLISKDIYQEIDTERNDYHLIMGVVDISLDEEMNVNEYLGYIAMYFVSIHLYNLTFGQYNLEKQKYVTDGKDNSNAKLFVFDLKKIDIQNYWQRLENMASNTDNTIINKKDFDLITNDRPQYIRVKLKGIESNYLSNNIKYELHGYREQYGNKTTQSIGIEHEDMINMILPGLIDNHSTKYIAYDIEWEFFEKFYLFKGKYQFIFKEIINIDNNWKYKIIVNGATMSAINMSMSYMMNFMNVWDSPLINHPLIDESLRDLWDRDERYLDRLNF